MKKEELVKALLEDYKGKELTEEIRAELSDKIQKAITAESAPTENTPVSEDILNAENKPSIADATTPTQLKEASGEAAKEAAEVEQAVAELTGQEVEKEEPVVEAKTDSQSSKLRQTKLN
jgi:hypothetical protein